MKILKGEYTLYINNKIRTLRNIVKVTNNGDKINLVSSNEIYNYDKITKTYICNKNNFKIVKFNKNKGSYDILDNNNNKIIIIKNNTLKKTQWNLNKIGFYDFIKNDISKSWLFNLLKESKIKIAIVDEGIQQRNNKNNNNKMIKDFNRLDMDISKSFNIKNKNLNKWWPSKKKNNHGTMCASVAISSGFKLYGTAPGLSFCSIKTDYTTRSYIDALKYNVNNIDIYSCSFTNPSNYILGYENDTKSIQEGAYLGRNGIGCIYIFCSGNDSVIKDLASFDYLMNIPETLVIGSTNKKNKRCYYSETGACLLCVAPGGETNKKNSNGIKVFNNQYKIKFTQGTSFSCPQVSGICGVILSINPNLSWVDAKDIISRSCDKNDPKAGKSNNIDDTKWFVNKAGRNYNLQYGFGLINYNNVISNTLAHNILPEKKGFMVELNKKFALNKPKTFSFKIENSNITTPFLLPSSLNLGTNEEIKSIDLSKFVIQEVTLIFQNLTDNNNEDLHELNISLSVNNRYDDDYIDQPVLIGRTLKVKAQNFANLTNTPIPISIEFLKGEQLRIDNKISEWSFKLIDSNNNIENLVGNFIGVQFNGYEHY